jgi:hypothetical protein
MLFDRRWWDEGVGFFVLTKDSGNKEKKGADEWV